jgi:hypothetical protein
MKSVFKTLKAYDVCGIVLNGNPLVFDDPCICIKASKCSEYTVLNDFSHEYCTVKDPKAFGLLLHMIIAELSEDKVLIIELNDVVEIRISDGTYYCDTEFTSGDIDTIVDATQQKNTKYLIDYISGLTFKANPDFIAPIF